MSLVNKSVPRTLHTSTAVFKARGSLASLIEDRTLVKPCGSLGFSSAKGWISCYQFFLMLLTEPAVQKLSWRLVAESGMLLFPVVENLDAIKGGCLDRILLRVANTVNPLVLEAIEPVPRRRVIPTVAIPAQRANHAVFLEFDLKGVAGVSIAPVRVVRQIRFRPPPEPGYRQRASHDVRGHARFERPTDNFPVDQIEHDRHIEPTFVLPQVSIVLCPDPIRCRWREVSCQKVVRHWQAVIRIRSDLITPLVPRIDAIVAHQPLDPLLTGQKASSTQLAHHVRAAIGAFEFSMDRKDE